MTLSVEAMFFWLPPESRIPHETIVRARKRTRNTLCFSFLSLPSLMSWSSITKKRFPILSSLNAGRQQIFTHPTDVAVHVFDAEIGRERREGREKSELEREGPHVVKTFRSFLWRFLFTAQFSFYSGVQPRFSAATSRDVKSTVKSYNCQ